VVILLGALGLALVALNTLVLAALVIVRPGGSVGLARRRRYLARRPRRQSPTVFNFWDELSWDQQDALESVATHRTYPRGATLFYEGQPADHVVVLRSGWTKICVRENGRERLLSAPLGVIASSHIYDTVIKDLDMEGFHRVRCKVKESSFVAWMQLSDPALPPA
jgi:CRP-like cAMP-binding protein